MNARRIFIVASVLFLSLFTHVYADELFAGGDGSVGSPFQIEDCLQLLNVNEVANGDYHFELANDIDCSDSENWNDETGFTPIGSYSGLGFKGHFDGRNYTISNLYQNFPLDTPYGAGLFFAIVDSTVRNLNIDSSFIAGYDSVGGLATVAASSTIQGIHITNSLIGTLQNGSTPFLGAGGLVGLAGSDIDSEHPLIFGSSVEDGYVVGYSEAGSLMFVGGLIGLQAGATIENSFSNVDVFGGLGTGGLSGIIIEDDIFLGTGAPAQIINSYAAGTVSNTQDEGAAGGLAGLVGTLSNIRQSFSVASTTAVNEVYAGGISGGRGFTDEAYSSLVDSASVYFDATLSTQSQCIGGEETLSCIAVNTGEEGDSTDGNYFIGNNTNGPLANFSSTYWEFPVGELPQLKLVTYTDRGLDVSWDDQDISSYEFEGSGTISDPYVVDSCLALHAIENDMTAVYELRQDLDCGTIKPIGYATSTPFSGAFWSPNPSEIYNLTYNINLPSDDYVGLFKTVDGGQVFGLNLYGSVVGKNYVGAVVGSIANGAMGFFNSHSSITASGSYVGGIAGSLSNTDASIITLNSSATIDVTHTTNDEMGNVGGLAGSIINSDIWGIDISSDITVTSTSGSSADVLRVGGFAGKALDWGVQSVTYNGAISIEAGGDIDSVGGIVGELTDGGIQGTSSSGSITLSSTNAWLVGGIVGHSVYDDGILPYFVGNSSDINFDITTSKHTQVVGGLAGYLDEKAYLDWSYYDGSISVTAGDGGVTGAPASIGGAVGLAGHAIIEDTYATSTISVSGLEAFDGESLGLAIGGFAGAVENTEVSNSYSTGLIYLTSPSGSGVYSDVGGFIGNVWGTSVVSNSFEAMIYDIDLSTEQRGISGFANFSTGTSANNYFDDSLAPDLGCSYTSEVSDCIGISSAGYFFNNSLYSPFDKWDFSNIWETSSDYPHLQEYDSVYVPDDGSGEDGEGDGEGEEETPPEDDSPAPLKNGHSAPRVKPTPAPVATPDNQAPIITRDLTLGATGDDVRLLQQFLISKGYNISAGATGYFGEQTRLALASYQTANNISPALGYFGPKTRVALGATGNVSTGSGASDLQTGVIGAQVVALQQFLISKGYNISAGATGYFGEQTRLALSAYQKASGISPASGYFGPITRTIMKSLESSDLWW